MNTALHFSSVDRNLETPPEVFDPLHAEFDFGLDACATDESARLPVYITPEIDTLTQDWSLWCNDRPVWQNMPYGDPEHPCKGAVRIAYPAGPDYEAETYVETLRCKKEICKKRGYHIDTYVPGIYDFVKHAWVMSRERDVVSVNLVPARTDTAWWHDFVWDGELHMPKRGVDLRFYRGRIRFRRGAEILDSAPFPSALIIFSPDAKRSVDNMSTGS